MAVEVEERRVDPGRYAAGVDADRNVALEQHAPLLRLGVGGQHLAVQQILHKVVERRAAVVVLLRFFLRRSSRRSAGANGIGDRLQKTVMQGLALCTMYIGVSGALKGQNTLIAILSVVIGAVIGELLDLDRAMNRAGEWVPCDFCYRE